MIVFFSALFDKVVRRLGPVSSRRYAFLFDLDPEMFLDKTEIDVPSVLRTFSPLGERFVYVFGTLLRSPSVNRSKLHQGFRFLTFH